MTAAEKRIDKLFDELVPGTGKAETVAGEIVRAVSRIGYRNYNDGDHIGVGYGNETCNLAARFLMEKCDKEIADIISKMWGIWDDEEYSEWLGMLTEKVADFIESHEELKKQENTEDMWDYFDKDEDRDDSFDDEDEDEEWDEEYDNEDW